MFRHKFSFMCTMHIHTLYQPSFCSINNLSNKARTLSVYITGVSVHMESCLSHLNRNNKPSIAHSFIFDLNLKAIS